MKKIKLQSEYPCLIYAENKHFFLDEDEIIELEDRNIAIYPINSKDIIPFKIDFVYYKAKHYRIVEDENFVHCFLFSPIVVSKRAIEKVKIAGIQLEISLSRKQISIKSDSEQIDLPIESNIKEYVCKSIENFLVISTSNFLVVYNPKTKFLKTYKGTSFELKNKEIIFCQKLSNFAKTKIEKNISFKEDVLSEKIVSIENNKYYLQEQCLCFAFLDCILTENYSLAQELLSSSFENVNEKDFVDFFGKFYKFFPLSTTRFVLIYPQENKIINFKQDNNKICDFEFVE